MDSLRLKHDWGPVSGEIPLHDLHRHHLRYAAAILSSITQESSVRLRASPSAPADVKRAGPRFALVGLWYLLTARPGQVLPGVVAVSGLVRTLTCGGWTYITSTDNHDWHDILMISYIVFTIPWTAGCLALSPPNPTAIKYRKLVAGGFFGTLVPLVYFFIQHKVHRVAGGRSWLSPCPPTPPPTIADVLTRPSLQRVRRLRMGPNRF